MVLLLYLAEGFLSRSHRRRRREGKRRGHVKGGEEKEREEAGMFLHELLRQVDAQEKPSPQLLAQVFRALKKSKVRERGRRLRERESDELCCAVVLWCVDRFVDQTCMCCTVPLTARVSPKWTVSTRRVYYI